MFRRSTGGTRAGAVALTVAMAAVGCGGNAKPPACSVSGKLIIGGKLAGGAHVTLHPVDPAQIARAVAVTQPDGSFQLTTYRFGDGAPPGEYVVTIYWPNPAIPYDECEGGDLVQHDLLCGLYFDQARSSLRVTIRPGPNELVLKAADLRGLFKQPPLPH